ncbi:hypothetical protein KEM52_002897, partial [Ascosphaera acerosa]
RQRQRQRQRQWCRWWWRRRRRDRPSRGARAEQAGALRRRARPAGHRRRAAPDLRDDRPCAEREDHPGQECECWLLRCCLCRLRHGI